MKTRESAADFFQRHGDQQAPAAHFNIYRIEDYSKATSFPHTRRDYYKIMFLTTATGFLNYADKTIAITDNALIFGNPMVPYSWEGSTENVSGYFCLFTEEFINNRMKTESLAASVLFRAGGYPVLYPDEKAVSLLSNIFGQLLSEVQTTYIHKYDLLRSYTQVIIHEALKITPANDFYTQGNSMARISSLFLALLDRQFPISSPGHLLKLKNASEFAAQLAVHTNHLNKALKETTGKTTSKHIAHRILSEAKALLVHSGWPVAEVGYCLGFEHASNFNIFFKKQTGQTPSHFRQITTSIS